MEPNTILNLTNTTNFADFAAEVRSGKSDILITVQYLERFSMRILRNLDEILSEQENHRLGWRLWSDRVFYECDDGQVRSLTELFGPHPRAAVSIFVASVECFRRSLLRQALCFAFPNREEVAF